MVDGEVIPCQGFPTLRTPLPIIRVPKEPALFNCKPSLIVLFLEYAAENLLENLSPPLASGKTVRVALDREQIIGK